MPKNIEETVKDGTISGTDPDQAVVDDFAAMATSGDDDDEVVLDDMPDEELGTDSSGKDSLESAEEGKVKEPESEAVKEPPATPEPAPAAPPATPEVKPEAAPTVPTAEPPAGEDVDLNAQYAEFVNKSIETLMGTTYKLTDEQKEVLDTSPSELLPKLAATVHMQVLTQATTMMANMLPQLMPMVMERESVDAAAERSFFEKFPKLADHREDVLRLARAYRQANPNTVGEQAIQEIGTMAMVALRLPFTQQEDPPLVATPPATPTRVAGGPAPQTAHKQGTVWSELADLEED